MVQLRYAAVGIYIRLTSLLPREFRRRHGGEMHLDFTDQVEACATPSELVCVVCRAYTDLVTSVVREWGRSDALKTLVCAGSAHTGIWLMAVAIAAWQWPDGSRLFPVVLTFAVMSAPGVAVAVWRQRFDTPRPSGCCSRLSAELD
jgi:hypothetical protein